MTTKQKVKKIVIRAQQAKKEGFTCLASKVKDCYSSHYYHVVDIDFILNYGYWPACPKGQLPSGAHCRIGTESRQIDWTKTTRR